MNKHAQCIYMTAASVLSKVNHSGQCEDLSSKTARCIGNNSKSKSGLLAKTSGVVTVSEILVYLIFLLRYRRCRSVSLSLNFYPDVKSRIYTTITSAEREVKDSQRSGMHQSCHFLTRLSKQSLYVFGSIRLFDEVRAELVRDISRSLRFL